jgi:hypothetical protein
MDKKLLSVNIVYQKNNNNKYQIEIIKNNTEDVDIDEINKQLLISYELYNLCIDKLNDEKLKDSDIEHLIKLNTEKIENRNQINIDNLNTQISIEKSKILCLESNIKDKIEIECNKIKNENQIEINNLRNQNEYLQKMIEEEKKNNNKVLEHYNTIYPKLDNIDKYFNKNTQASISGEIGEDFVFNYLETSLELTNANIKKVNGKSNACDLYLHYNYLHCGIEVKNHALSISQSQIKRFLNTDLNNPNYNCGIFISIKTDFADISNIKHFDIIFENNKPAIFISKFIVRPMDIILAIKILDFIIYNQKFNISDINKYITMLTNNIETLNSIIEINSDNIKNLNKSNLLIKNKQMEIEELLNIPKVNDFICEKCNKVFKKKITLDKHLTTCKSK